MSDLASVRVTVYGYVQGVYFRDFACRQARALGLTGYVRNLRQTEAVEVEAEGERAQLEKLIGYLEVGPPAATVTRVATAWSEYTGNHSDFKIRY
ncbi:MAG: acylphosphatase [Dehalococcoidales bacterium]|nr:acylphosphatase [Dehalococcoidales bacterium]